MTTSILDCMMKIEVTNMSSQLRIGSGSYSMKVPFSSLSRTMQFIHRSGGKIVEVTKLSAIAALANLPPIETAVYASTVRAPSPSVNLAQAAQKTDPDRSKRGGKQTKK
jgi:hypothetical protein